MCIFEKYCDAVRNYYQTANRPYSSVGSNLTRNLVAEYRDCIFEDSSRLLIVGHAGTGKTTFLDELMLESSLNKKFIPVFVSLRNYSSNIYDLLNASVVRFNESCSFSSLRSVSERKVIMLLDGYDEIPNIFVKQAQCEIAKLTNEMREEPFVVTSRPTEALSLDIFHSWTKFDMPLLTDEEVFDRIKQMRNSEKLLSLVRTDDNIMELARRPLFLYTIETAEKCDKDINTYLMSEMNRYAIWRGHTKSLVPVTIKYEDVERALSEIAFALIKDSLVSLNVEIFDSICGHLQSDATNASGLAKSLKDSGMLRFDGDAVSFIHKSSLEAYAAMYLKNLVETELISNTPNVTQAISCISASRFSREIFRAFLCMLPRDTLIKFLSNDRSIASTVVDGCSDVLVGRFDELSGVGARSSSDIAKTADSITRDSRHNRPDILVFSVHGINTRGEWKNDLSFELTLHTDGYRYLSVPWDYGSLRFGIINPYTICKCVERFHEFYDAKMSYISSGTQVVVVAHSFGAYIVTKALSRFPGIKFDRMLLLSAAMRRKYKWDSVSSRCGQVLSIMCGDDFALNIARFLPWIGGAGRYGFKSAPDYVCERFESESKHSDIFGTSYIRKVWIPFFRDGAC